MIEEIKSRVIQTALKDMFKGGHFNICNIDKCLKIAGTVADQETYEMLSALHCVDFKAMGIDVRQWCFEATLNLFDNTGFDLEMVNGVLQQKNLMEEGVKTPGFFKKLGIG